MSFIKKNKFLILLFVLYLCCIAILFHFHENWRDEAQAYLICRDMNLGEIFRNAYLEGHPILYYLCLYPFVQLGIGPKIVNFFSFFCMSIAAYLILFHSKLNIIQKVSILISYPTLYEYSVIGRSYSLAFLLLVIVGLLYEKKEESPILFGLVLGLLLNTHLMLAFFSCGLALLFYGKEFLSHHFQVNKKIWISFFSFLFFCILLFLQFYPLLLANDSFGLDRNLSFSSFFSVLAAMTFGFSGNINLISFFVSVVVLVYVFLLIFQQNKILLFFLLMNYLFMGFLIFYVFGAQSLHHVELGYCIFVSVILMLGEKILHKKMTVLLIFMSLLSLPTVIRASSFDISYPYSNGEEASNYILENIDEDAVFLCKTDSLCSTLVSYVSNRFYHTNSERYFTYVVWTTDRERPTNFKHMQDFINSHKSVYYIYTGYYKEDDLLLKKLKENYSLKKKYQSKIKSFSLENYTIYEIRK